MIQPVTRQTIPSDEATEAALDAAWQPFADNIKDKFNETGLTYGLDDIHKNLRSAFICQANTFRLADTYTRELKDERYDKANQAIKGILGYTFKTLMAHGKPEEVVRGYLGAIVGKTMQTIIQVFPDVERKELLAPRDAILPGFIESSYRR